MTNEFKEHACEFKNEADCEEELEESGIPLNKAEREFYVDE